MDLRMEMEVTVIGSLLAGCEDSGPIIADLDEAAFSTAELRSIYSAIKELFCSGKPVDKLSVLSRAGSDYAGLIDACLPYRMTSAAFYAGQVQSMARVAKAHDLAAQISLSNSVEDVSGAVGELNALMVAGPSRAAVSAMDTMLAFADRHVNGKKPNFLRFGMAELDKLLFVEPGDFVCIGGYPSDGKSLLALQFCLCFAKQKRTAFFSLETSPEKLTDRLVSHAAAVPLERIKANELTDEDWTKINYAAQSISKLPLDIVPAAGMTAADIQAYTMAHRYEVVIIDYLQLIRDNSRGGRYEQVTNISQALHTMAQQNKVTVVALSQLSRPDKSMKNPPPPSMSSFRESGQIEQDVDVALLLYKEDPNNYRSRRVLKIAKNKEGERDVIYLAFKGETQTMTVSRNSYEEVQKAAAKQRRERAQTNTPTLYDIDDADGPLPF